MVNADASVANDDDADDEVDKFSKTKSDVNHCP